MAGPLVDLLEFVEDAQLQLAALIQSVQDQCSRANLFDVLANDVHLELVCFSRGQPRCVEVPVRKEQFGPFHGVNAEDRYVSVQLSPEAHHDFHRVFYFFEVAFVAIHVCGLRLLEER